jgi:ElaB/YqjD/DUF883 family membrane-anchored ribosome-binding protein
MTNDEQARADASVWADQGFGASDPASDDVLIDDAGSGDPDIEVEVLVAEIDDTRADLGETIDEIGRRLEPGNVAREAGQSVRDATTRKVDHMTTGIQETFDDVRRGNASGIVGTITSNPVPAAMVAVGLGLLFMNRGAQSSGNGNGNGGSRGYGQGYGQGYGPGYSQYGAGDWRQWPEQGSQGSPIDRASSRVSAATGEASETVQQFAGQASQKVQDVGDQVSQTASQVGDQAGMAMQRGTSQARRMFEENPLAVGVVAVAAGAAIGMLAPSTEAERRTLGPARDRFVEQAEQQVNQAIDTMDQGASQSSSGSTGSGGTSTESVSGSSSGSSSSGTRRRSTSKSTSGTTSGS